MKVSLKIVRHHVKNPEKIFSTESIELEDVASYEVTDKEIKFKFNATPDETIVLNTTPNEYIGEWYYLDISSTRIGLKIDMSQ